MIIDEMKIGNTEIFIHDDCIVSEDKIEQIESRLSVLAYNHQLQEKNKAAV